jgi:hypothetical protein
MVLAMQNPNWTIPAKFGKYVLDNDTEIKERWDGRVLWTGLSAGGQSVEDAMAMNFPGAFVPMSMAEGAQPSYKTIKYKLWAFHSDPDSQCPFYVSKELVNNCNAYFPGSAKLTLMKNPVTGAPDGHGNWNYYYDPAYREAGKNIYEWAFDTATAAPAPTPNPVLTNGIAAVAEVRDITISTATLDGSKSLGNITWASWRILKQPPGSDWNVFVPAFDNSGLVNNVRNLAPGDYTFELTIKTPTGIGIAPVSFTVASAVSPVFVEAVIPAGKTKVIVRQDKTVEFS